MFCLNDSDTIQATEGVDVVRYLKWASIICSLYLAHIAHSDNDTLNVFYLGLHGTILQKQSLLADRNTMLDRTPTDCNVPNLPGNARSPS